MSMASIFIGTKCNKCRRGIIQAWGNLNDFTDIVCSNPKCLYRPEMDDYLSTKK
jgi:hypothetical protein